MLANTESVAPLSETTEQTQRMCSAAKMAPGLKVWQMKSEVLDPEVFKYLKSGSDMEELTHDLSEQDKSKIKELYIGSSEVI